MPETPDQSAVDEAGKAAAYPLTERMAQFSVQIREIWRIGQTGFLDSFFDHLVALGFGEISEMDVDDRAWAIKTYLDVCEEKREKDFAARIDRLVPPRERYGPVSDREPGS